MTIQFQQFQALKDQRLQEDWPIHEFNVEGRCLFKFVLYLNNCGSVVVQLVSVSQLRPGPRDWASWSYKYGDVAESWPFTLCRGNVVQNLRDLAAGPVPSNRAVCTSASDPGCDYGEFNPAGVDAASAVDSRHLHLCRPQQRHLLPP